MSSRDEKLSTDYLVVGAGAAGMAFTDELLTHSDATVTIVDRRHAPGGHWIDAYPYVRLHQPSALYGVSSTPLGQDSLDAAGMNAGFYELAGGDEIRAYYEKLMHRRFLPSGRVRYFPRCEYQGEKRFASLLTGEAWQVEVRRKVVDTTYLEGSFPATSAPPFEVADGVRCVHAGEITRVGKSPAHWTVVGSGKTAMDACVWLLEQGVPPSSIRWIKPREPWCINRRFQQPLTLLPELCRGMAIQLECMAQATSVDDAFLRLESEGILLRVDPHAKQTMFHGSLISESEVAQLRRIEDVVRMGHVRRIERDAIAFDGGRVPASEGTVYVHCAAQGVATHRELVPIFQPGRIVVQPMFSSFVCFQFALLGVVEATLGSDDEKNRLCPPISYWDVEADFLIAFLAAIANNRARAAHPAVANWARSTRLNPMSGIGAFLDDPGTNDSMERMAYASAAAASNLTKLLAGKAN